MEKEGSSSKTEWKGKQLAGKQYKKVFTWELWEAREVPMEPAEEERQNNKVYGGAGSRSSAWNTAVHIFSIYYDTYRISDSRYTYT